MSNPSGKRKSGDQIRRGPIWLRQAIGNVHQRIDANTVLQTSDMSVSDTPKGKLLRMNKKGSPAFVPARPLKVEASGFIVFGTIAGEIPKIGSTPINASSKPVLDLTGSGLRYVVAKVTCTATQTTLGDKVLTTNLTGWAVVLSVETEAPGSSNLQSSGGTSCTFKFILASVADETNLISQNGYGPITAAFDDVLDGSGKVILQLGYPTS